MNLPSRYGSTNQITPQLARFQQWRSPRLLPSTKEEVSISWIVYPTTCANSPDGQSAIKQQVFNEVAQLCLLSPRLYIPLMKWTGFPSIEINLGRMRFVCFSPFCRANVGVGDTLYAVLNQSESVCPITVIQNSVYWEKLPGNILSLIVISK